jgi:YHS domain-containing protein/thiol-disulfide isomerase/thioredoxin
MRAFSRFIAAGCMTLLAATWTLGADSVRWAPDFETAMHQAAQQNRLVLAHFWNDGCPPCVIVDRQVFPSPQVADAVHASYVPVKVHAGQRADLARRFGVEQWPTDVFLTPSGQKVAEYISPKTPHDYSQMVSYIASREQGRLAAAGAPGRPTPMSSGPAANLHRDSSFPLGANSGTNSGGPGRASYEVQAGGEFPLPNSRGAGAYPSQSPSLPQGDLASSYRPAGNTVGQGFPSQTQSNSAPPLMNPFSQNPSPYLGAGAAPVGDATRHPALPVNSPFASGVGGPQGGLGNPALNLNSSWPPNTQGGLGQSTPAGNAPAQVSQPPMSSGYNSSFQSPPMQNPAIQAPGVSAGISSQYGAPQQQTPPAGPKFAMDGYCVVSLMEQIHLPVNQQQWRKGDLRWGAVHRGQTYLFATQADQQKFLANPDHFTPVLSGFDPVLFVEQNQLVEGRREHGFTHEGRIYMFATEQNLQKFWSSRDMFISRVQQAMSASANPQRR